MKCTTKFVEKKFTPSTFTLGYVLTTEGVYHPMNTEKWTRVITINRDEQYQTFCVIGDTINPLCRALWEKTMFYRTDEELHITFKET